MRKRLLSLSFIALLVLAVSGTAAFGSKAKSASSSPIKVGQMVAVGGAINFPDIVSATKGAILSLNKRGGIEGHPVVLDECNEGNSATQSVACARKFVSDKVVADVASQDVYAEAESGAILEKAGIPQIGDNALGAVGWVDQPNTFLLYYTSTNLTEAPFGQLCKKAGDNKLDAPYLNFGPAPNIVKSIEYGAKKSGETIVATPAVPATQTDFTSIVSAGLAAGANCFGGVVLDFQYQGILNALHALGSKAKVIISAGNFDPADFQQAGALANQMLVVSPYPVPTDTTHFPVFKKFQADMKAELATGDKNAPYNQAGARANAINAWFAVQAFATVMNKSKDPLTSAGIMKAMKAAKNVNLGLPTLWSPNNPGPKSIPRAWTGAVYFQGYKGGKLTDLSTKTINGLPLAGL